MSGPTFQSNKRKPVISRPSLDCGSRSISKKLATQKNSRHNEKPAAITWSGTSNSPHQLIRIRNSMPQTESITAEFYPGDTISPKRTFRKSLLNPENSYLDSLTQDHDLAMMPAGATEIPGRELKRATTISILEEIEALPFPSNSLVPSSLQDFPMDFVRECIRGDNATFAICGRATRDKQIVNWPEMMKLNPETHPFCPSPGNNGALAFVDGRPNTGEVGKTYPTLLRENVGFYKYIGNYKVVERIVMPIEIWKACTDDERLGVVDEIENREWGQTLLTFKGLCTNATDKEEKRINDLLGFFERSEEPCLRMSWTLVQFVSFEEKDYNILVGALKEYKMAREMEHGIEDDASSVASNNTSRGLSADSANQVVNRGIQQPDQLQLSREDLQISSPKDINGIPASISEGEFRPVNKNTPGPAKVAIMSTPTASLALTNNSSPFVLKVPVSVRSTIPSSTNDSSDSTPPDCLSQRENGRWHVHAGRSSRVLDLTISNPEPQSAESQTTSVPIKRQYEEEVDLYGVSPPLQSQQAPVGQMNIARPPSRTLQEILASFSNAKRRRLADSNEKNAGE